MNYLAAILIMGVLFFSQEEKPEYYSLLKEGLQSIDSEYTVESYQNLANCCDRILNVAENSWLPYYYKVYAYTHLGYMAESEERKEVMYDIAQATLEEAMKIRPDESENHVLQAMIYFGRMQINPMRSAMIYFPKANAELSKAKQLDPMNPRVYYLIGQSLLHKPKFLGGGKDAARPFLKEALFYYEKFEGSCGLYPSWGREKTLELYNSCIKDLS
jgi:tetratricopeptide (TPR) repeat protein